MKSNIRDCEDPVLSSPLLFTPSQKEKKKRKLNYEYNESQGLLSPTTPGLSGLFRSPNLPEGAHINTSPRRIKDDSFLIELLKSNNSRRNDESVQFSSQRNVNDWLFDTPPILKSSPIVRNQGVSRRSLDKIMDPDTSFSWVESMATPPSDSIEINIATSITTIPDKGSSSRRLIEQKNEVSADCTKNKTIEDEDECLCQCTQSSAFQINGPKKGVARVLFGAVEQDNEDKDDIVVVNADNSNQDPYHPEDLPFSCSISSCEDENFSLSPPVVDTQDNIASKSTNFSQCSTLMKNLEKVTKSYFDKSSSKGDEEKERQKCEVLISKNIMEENNAPVACTESTHSCTAAEVDVNQVTLKKAVGDKLGISTEIAEKSCTDKNTSSLLESPTIVSNVRYSKRGPRKNVLVVSSDSTSKSKDSAVSDDATLIGSPTAVSNYCSKQSNEKESLHRCRQGMKMPKKQGDNGVVADNVCRKGSDEVSLIDTTLCEESSKHVQYTASFCTEISSLYQSPGVATDDYNHPNKLSTSSFLKSKRLFQTPEKISSSNISGISEITLSPTVVASCTTKVEFTPFGIRSQYNDVIESTPKMSKSNLNINTTSSNVSVSFQDCPLSPAVVKSSICCKKNEVKSPDEVPCSIDAAGSGESRGITCYPGNEGTKIRLSEEDSKKENLGFQYNEIGSGDSSSREGKIVPHEKMLSSNVFDNFRALNDSTIADDSAEVGSICFFTEKRSAKSNVINDGLNENHICEKKEDGCLIKPLSSTRPKEIQTSEILNEEAIAVADFNVDKIDNYKDQEVCSYSEKIFIDGTPCRAENRADATKEFINVSFNVDASSSTANNHVNKLTTNSKQTVQLYNSKQATISTCTAVLIHAKREHSVPVDINDAANGQAGESGMEELKIETHSSEHDKTTPDKRRSLSENQEDHEYKNMDGGKISIENNVKRGISHQGQGSSSNYMDSAVVLAFKDESTIKNKEEYSNTDSLNDVSFNSDNIAVSTEVCQCDRTSAKARADDEKHNIKELKYHNSFSGNFSSYNISRENDYKNSLDNANEPSLHCLADRYVTEDSRFIRENNIVDMDVLTEIPYDFDKSFGEKGYAGHRMGNFIENALQGDNKLLDKCSFNMDGTNGDKIDVLLGKDQPYKENTLLENTHQSKVIFNEIAVETSVEKAEEPYYEKELSEHGVVKSLQNGICDKEQRGLSNSNRSRCSDDKGFHAKFSVKQPRPHSDSSTEDMLDELMFGRNGPNPKRKRLENCDDDILIPKVEGIDEEPNSNPHKIDDPQSTASKNLQTRDTVNHMTNLRQSSFEEFSTGTSKRITMPIRAIEQEKHMLEDTKASFSKKLQVDNQNNLTNCPISRDVCINEESTFKGFFTGTGKTITTSAEAMERAKCMFEDSEAFFSVSFSEDSLTKCPIVKDVCIHKKEPPLKGFCTGTGKAVITSKKAIQRAKRMFEENETDFSVSLNEDSLTKCPIFEDVCIDNKMPSLKGFCTGTGKTVTASGKAIQRANRVFEESETDVSLHEDNLTKCPIVDDVCIHQKESSLKRIFTCTGKAVPTSVEAIQRAKQMFEDIITSDIQKGSRSFSSDYGITINTETLQPSSTKDNSEDQGAVVIDSNLGNVNSKEITQKDKVFNELTEKEESARSVDATYNAFDTRKENYTEHINKCSNLSEAETKILSDCMVNNAFDIEEFTQLRDNGDCFQRYNTASTDDLKAKMGLASLLRETTQATASRKLSEVHNVVCLNEEASVRCRKDISQDASSSCTEGDCSDVLNSNALNVRRTRLRANRTAKSGFKHGENKQEAGFASSKHLDDDVNGSLEFKGFSTGLGKRISVSETALQNAKKILDDDKSIHDDPNHQRSNAGESCLDSLKNKNLARKGIGARLFDRTSNCTEANVDYSKFVGFNTGTGKKVEISEKALNAAKKRLESVESKEDKDFSSSKTIVGGPKFVGFNTGTGKKVEISEKSLNAAKKRLGSVEVKEDKDFSSSNTIVGGSKFVGFNTGTGKKVEISEKALNAAKKRLESVEVKEDKDFSSSNTIVGGPKFVGFSTGTGKKVEISEKALNAAKKRLESVESKEDKDLSSSNTIVGVPKFVGFSTGTGKKVEISEKALNAAKKRLESVEVKEDKDFSSSNTIVGGPRFVGFSTGTGKKVEISEKALNAAKKRLESVEVKEDKDFSSSNTIVGGPRFVGFSTGTGKKVEILEKALNAAKKRLESVEVKEDKDFSSSNTIVGGPRIVGFSTGTGKKVEISEKALNAAKKRLESVEVKEDKDFSSSNTIVGGPRFVGFSTGTGKKVEISEKALNAAKKRLESVEVKEDKDFSSSNTIVGGPRFVGFSTGTGKKVEISEKVLNAAKKRLESVESKEGENSIAQCNVSIDHSRQNYREDEKSSIEGSDSKLSRTSTGRHDKDIKHQRREGNEIPKFRKPDVYAPIIESKFSTGRPSWEVVEMSQRFDEDIIKSIEENPCLLDVKRRCNNSIGDVLARQTKDGTEKENQVPEWKMKDCRTNSVVKATNCLPNYEGTPVRQEEATSTNEVVTSKRSIAGLRSKSKYTFKAKPTTPAGYHSDRIAKFTTPLVSKTAIVAEFNTPIAARSAPDNPRKLLHDTISKSMYETPLTSQPGKSDSKENSFRTPFIKSNVNAVRSSSGSSSGKKRSKRPLFSCVPFSSKRQKTDDQCEPKDTEELKVIRKAGRLFLMKQSSKQKKTLSRCNYGQPPGCYSRGEAYKLGVNSVVLDVTSENALDFVFNQDFFSEDTLAKGSLIVGDGAILKLTLEGNAGFQEFKSAFRLLPGVENSLFGDDWLANHYRWIVWKLASMERSFPEMFAGRCLTPNEVMYHLKYRYDKEIDAAERPALKKILERDDISSRRLVLCVSKIYSTEEQPKMESKNQKSDAVDKKFSQQNRIIELTDGWYAVKATLDKPLSNFVNNGRVFVGLKLCVYGADLIGSEQAVPPLEAPDSLMLVLHANSTRRAHWDAKLGFQADRRAFPVPLCSLFPDGGLVGCVDIVILRSYPIQWMEKTENGCIFRNFAQEQKEAKKYCEQKQIRMEKLYARIQKEAENSSQPKVTRQSRRRSLNPSVKEIDKMRTGQELFDLLNMASDPATFEMMLSDSQKELVAQFRVRKEEEQRSLMQKKFDDAWKEIQEEFPDRCVVSLQKFRVADYKIASGKPRIDAFITVWKPKEEMRETWKEGARIKGFNLSASAPRYKHTKSKVQLATVNTTRYEEQKTNSSDYSKRKIIPFSQLKHSSNDGFNEIDIVGYVIHVEQHGSMSELQTVYIADLSDTFVAVKFWGGLKAFSLEDSMRQGCLICIQNLVLRSESHSGEPIVATFCDLSRACRAPKEFYLKQAVNEIKSQIQDVASFLLERQEFLKTKLPFRNSKSLSMSSTPKSSHTYSPTLLERLNDGSAGKLKQASNTLRPVKTEENNFPMNLKTYTPKRQQSSGMNHLTAINLISGENVKESIVVDAQKKLNNIKRRALVRYGEPDTINPSAANITPKARRAFKPPSIRKI